MSSNYNFISPKLDFIMQNIYPSDRTCFNWLNYEWKYRRSRLLTGFIQISHEIEDINSIQDPKKVIALTMNPHKALHHYLKFNPTLNQMGEQGFLYGIQLYNEKLTTLNRDILILNSEHLYTSVLDREYYGKIIEFLNIEDNYDIANMVHKVWYDLNERSIELVKHIPKQITFSPWKSKSVSDMLTNQAEYDIILEQINRIYENNK